MLILVSGGSCAGKSTFAAQLNRTLISEGLSGGTVSTDLFYHDLPADTPLERHNFDSEDSVDSHMMLNVCSRYASGTAPFPVFDFRTHKRSGIMEIPPLSVLILEGIFSLSFPQITALPSLKVFINTGDSERYKRRLAFYSETLGHSREFIDYKFFKQAEPYYRKAIEPWQYKADLAVSGEKDFGPAVSRISELWFRSFRETASRK